MHEVIVKSKDAATTSPLGRIIAVTCLCYGRGAVAMTTYRRGR